MRKSKILFIFIIISSILLLNVSSFANYLGSGKWPMRTANFNIDNLPSAYKQPVANGAAMWRDNTNFKLYYSNTNYQISTYAFYYGKTIWDGVTFNTPGAPYNSTYTSSNIQFNRTYCDLLLTLYPTNIKVISCHEFGHVLSLDHNTKLDSIMYGSSVLNATSATPSLETKPGPYDISEINNRYN